MKPTLKPENFFKLIIGYKLEEEIVDDAHTCAIFTMPVRSPSSHTNIMAQIASRLSRHCLFIIISSLLETAVGDTKYKTF